MEDSKTTPVAPIAIIGSGCRFPGGCNSPQKLWELLKHPVDLLIEVPHARFSPEAFYHENPEHPGTTNVTKAYLLQDDPCTFDNDFFNISTREAESMDPQQRMILETVYESVESAGYSISQLTGSSTGVFVGQMSDDYRDLLLRDLDNHPQYAGTGIARSILANRVSYVFDWKGPSVNVDTACSSSLVALHLAAQSLRSGECDMAIVAGVNLVFGPELFSFLSSLRMLSPNGRSRMWDASADGYARGEGFASIVLKTLDRAQRDGDNIESVIRNTGVIQDGRSSGLTVPSAAAQAELMRLTYSRCGLDCQREEDRCQYFEAHGTGTQAGDPKEAEGISTAFFPNKGHGDQATESEKGAKIRVGSIKTVIGHLEGTAGLASILKASQAVKYGLIPPNLHFNELNPAIKPFYHHLEVPTRLEPWPQLPPGAPRRASVNSFGFGGTNAHVIIDSYDEHPVTHIDDSKPPSWGPFVLSANSEKAVAASVALLSSWLKGQKEINLTRLAWTLQTRRERFAYRTSFSAASEEDLVVRLDFALKAQEQAPIATRATKVSNPRILGVFTGQGAQWASMGASLYLHCVAYRRTIQHLDSVLREIPEAPDWSLAEELVRNDDPTRISSAEISQPLCAALQVALVDLLRECGIEFSAVVGHSSGEIAAAYAAGILTARDAILIAFYRGYHCNQFRDSNRNAGKMMAVDMAPEDAETFCQQPRFLGRIVVAAKNSQSSVTLSGDAESIDEAKASLDEKSVFSRVLKVDKAYHSHHMASVKEPYIQSLKKANIQPKRNCFGASCNWYSSVYIQGDSSIDAAISFEYAYWADNMTNPVEFSHAVTTAVEKEHFDIALEIGPHPALQRPATEGIKGVLGDSIPYKGVMERNKDALEIFSGTLGFLWTVLDSLAPLVDFEAFRKACEGPEWMPPRVQTDLPQYPWDHDKVMFKESRKSKAWRTRNTQMHELLGYPDPGSGLGEVRWRNVLRLSDVEWLKGHQFQNQVLLPAAGYLVMALDASLHLVGGSQPIQLVELQGVEIHNGVTLEEGSPPINMDFVIRLEDENPESKMAVFYCDCSNADAASAEFDKRVFSGRVLIKLGRPVRDVLPSRVAPNLPVTDVTTDRFYDWMQKAGLRYSSPFLLSSIKRRLNLATVTTMRMATNRYIIHPGTLDSILQGIYPAYSYPGDGRVWTTYLPKSFRCVRFNISSCRKADGCENTHFVADCYLTESSARFMRGDIDVFCANDGHPEIQIQDIFFSALEAPAPANDQSMFWQTIWKRRVLSADKEACVQIPLASNRMLHDICERTVYFYLNQICREIGRQDTATMEWYYRCLIDWALGWMRPAVPSGQLGLPKAEWETDTLESLMAIKQQYFDSQIDLELIHRLGSSLPAMLHSSQPTLQILRENDMLEKLYTDGLGVAELNHHLEVLLSHLTHEHPRLRVLEIGAGTGGTTSEALRHLGSKLESYTFTDISPGYFSAAQTRFAEYKGVMGYQVLDIERPPVEQGFQAHSYDLVIAAHVLHATKSISETVKSCRELLRPGGYLILLELTNPESLRIPFIFSGLPGWWLGHKDGRSRSPALTEAEWDMILRENLFSGLDIALRDFEDDFMHSFTVLLSQAVDDRVNILRDPLHKAGDLARIQSLFIVGGRSRGLSNIATRLLLLLRPFAKKITVVNELDAVPTSGLEYGSAVIWISGLEKPAFRQMTEQRLSAVQCLFRNSKYLLCVTKNCHDEDPYTNIVVGIARSTSRELAHLRLQLVKVDHFHYLKNQPEATMFSEMMLQMICLDLPGYDEILWKNETEIAIECGEVLIPRVYPHDELNNRFNSARRTITRTIDPTSIPVGIFTTEKGIVLGTIGSEFEQSPQATSTMLPVLSSSLFRFACSDDSPSFYLSLCLSEDRKQKVLVISNTNSSAIMADPSCTIHCTGSGDADELLSAILTVVIYEDMLASSSGTIWVHDIDDVAAEAIHSMANNADASVFLTTTNSASKLIASGRTNYIHPRAVHRQLKSLVPRDITRFINKGEDADAFTKFAVSFLGQKLDIYQHPRHVDVKQTISLSCSKSGLKYILTHYCGRPDLLYELGHPTEKTVVKADLVHEQSATTMAPTSIISWTGIQSVQVPVTPAVDANLFSDQKTYFLIGLTGDVGWSLCDWMAGRGAKYLAIASRNPAVPPEIIAHLRRGGITVRIFSVDIASMGSLTSVHQEIVSTMPPIAGVANAALVVRDHPFDSMSFEDLEAVFKPKIIGSQNLDRLFYSEPLDFFILFSSIASIVGKPGQSGYNAANLFMTTLAVQRRKRGLAASVMHFGILLGFGFIHGQAGSTVEARFRQDDLPAFPEPSFHAIFAQAILSGRPESGEDPEVMSGLGTEIDTPWRAIPRFGHCRVKTEEGRMGDNNHHQGRTTQSVRDRLQGADNSEQAFVVLKSAISSRVGLALGSPGEELDDTVGLVSLGLDSLVAVEIRSWILKLLDIDVPVMKLLGGLSLRDICHDLLGKLPPPSKQGHEQKLLNGAIHSPDLSDPTEGPQNSHGRSSQKGTHNIDSNDLNVNTPSLSRRESHTSTYKPSQGSIPDERKEQLRCQRDYERTGDMSHAQAQLYFLHEYLQSNAYNVAYSGYFKGRLDMTRLKEALIVVGKRHEAIRSSYYMDLPTARPVQAVLREPRIILAHREARHDDAQAEMEAVKDFKFEIEKGIVMKITVLSYSPISHFIIFNHHHIALDGIGWSLFIADLAKAYKASLKSLPADIRIQQSIELAERQLKGLTGQNLRADLAYWRDIYKTIPELLPLFGFAKVKTRPEVRDYAINTVDIKLSSETTRFIEKAASNIGVTSFHFYLASLATFLARCLGIGDVAIGVVDANRTEAEDMQTIGYYLNMLPLRVQFGQSEPFNALARRCRDTALDSLSHARAPIDMILSSLGISRSTAHHPLFQVAINYRRAELSETDFGSDGKIEWDGAVPGGHPYDLLLNVASTRNWTFVSFITQRSLYEASDSALMLKWFTRSLEALARDTSCQIMKFPIANETDITEALELGRGDVMEIPWDGIITDRIKEMATEFPESFAIRDDEDKTFSYEQTMVRVAQIIGQLQGLSLPIDGGSRVAMLLDPVSDAVCCMIAILQLGFIWIPLDTRNHPERLRAVLKESRPQALVCHLPTKELAQQIASGLKETSICYVDQDNNSNSENKKAVSQNIAKFANGARLNQPAIILYTSGSTGVPKGVMLTHKGLITQIHGTTAALGLGRETTLQQSPLGFDLMLDQVFLALCNGGTVVMVGKAGRGDPTHMAKVIVENAITLTHFVPSEYLALLNYGHNILAKGRSWRYAMSGGERMGPELRKAFRNLDCETLRLVNVYGPAEITVACARGIVPYRELSDEPGHSNDYLRPSINYGLEIVDADMNILPVGFVGEICISGEGVGLGYLERPEESARKFTTRKRLAGSSDSTPRIYRSGDKGRLLPDGTLNILGRLDGDSQVKIHGFRVELDEIANAIVQVAGGAVVNAAASYRPGQLSGVLIAFVVFNISFTGSKPAFLKWLRGNIPLPLIMRPRFIVPIDRVPANSNGKTDRHAVDRLPILNSEGPNANGTDAHILGHWERLVKEAWDEALLDQPLYNSEDKRVIEPSSDFFEVGGNSILMIKLRSLLQVQLGVKISMPELFHASTLSGMATLYANAEDAAQKTKADLAPLAKSFLNIAGKEQSTDWNLEISSMVDTLPQPEPTLPLLSADDEQLEHRKELVVVLTGATGFIGRHLLSRLVQDPRVAEVHCLAIRPDPSSGRQRHVSVQSPKITEYGGDLTGKYLGLSEEQVQILAARADAVIHNGADVSLLKTYQTLRRANVLSTRTLCAALALPRRLPVHYVSTASVAKVVREELLPLGEVAPAPHVSALLDVVDGYAATKWASEMVLDGAAARRALPAYVHRLAHVVGDDASELDVVGMMTKYSVMLRAMPRIRLEDVVGVWDFVGVEDVVRDMVESMVASAVGGGDAVQGGHNERGARFINHCSLEKLNHEKLRSYLEDIAGGPVREIEMEEWLVAAQAKGLHPLTAEFFAAFDNGRGKLVLPVIVKGV